MEFGVHFIKITFYYKNNYCRLDVVRVKIIISIAKVTFKIALSTAPKGVYSTSSDLFGVLVYLDIFATSYLLRKNKINVIWYKFSRHEAQMILRWRPYKLPYDSSLMSVFCDRNQVGVSLKAQKKDIWVVLRSSHSFPE